MATEIKIRRDALETRRGLAWTYSWATPSDITWTSADGTSRPGPRVGEYVGYGTGLAGLRDMLRRKFGPDLRVIETWKQAASTAGNREMRKPGNCPFCKGHGRYLNSFSATRRCGTCKGTGNAPERIVREFKARELVFAELETIGGQDKWYGRSAFGRLRDTAPERFARLLDSVEAGRVNDVARCLVAYHPNEVWPLF